MKKSCTDKTPINLDSLLLPYYKYMHESLYLFVTQGTQERNNVYISLWKKCSLPELFSELLYFYICLISYLSYLTTRDFPRHASRTKCVMMCDNR